jgi:hypothetical protein
VAGDSLITKIGKAFFKLIALRLVPEGEVEFFGARVLRARPP